jgi:hypothetical protein
VHPLIFDHKNSHLTGLPWDYLAKRCRFQGGAHALFWAFVAKDGGDAAADKWIAKLKGENAKILNSGGAQEQHCSHPTQGRRRNFLLGRFRRNSFQGARACASLSSP